MLIDSSMVISGFVSKVVNDCGDILKKKIKDADYNRKSYSQNIETRIYQVTIDALNEFTKDKYKGLDTLYDAAESILKEFKCGRYDNTETVKSGLKILGLQVAIERCKDFLGTLCYEICKDENDVLYKEISMIQQQQVLKDVHDGFQEIHQNDKETIGILADVKEDTKYIRSILYDKEVGEVEHHSAVHIENRAEEYAKKWDKNVFLNNFNERDENKGANIKLRELYLEKQLPHYIWKTNENPRKDLKELLKEYIVDNNDKKMLLILGQPGIGKSTLITWIMANLAEKKDDILVYQFASDLKNVNWQDDNILSRIFKIINRGYGNLENKVLILDGFDEIHTSSDRKRILDKLNQDLNGMNYLKKFTLIITCRENYIDKLQNVGYDYITLQAWDEEQIKTFCKIYEEKNTDLNIEIKNDKIQKAKINKILENKEILGIPLILYMVLALNVEIEKSSSIVDIYDQIFSLDSGRIYYRCYDVEHRINEPKIKEQIHKISQRTAFWIFENNAEKAFIPQDDFKKICDNVSENIQSDVLIGNYFKCINHCDGIGSDELHFIHRSIYEYFVVVYFFESIHNLAFKKEAAGILGELLKDGHLTEQILEFIKYKFDNMKRYNLSDATREIFQMMLHDGMTYHMGEQPCENVLNREMNIFVNMLEVVHLWNSELGALDDKIVLYLKYVNTFELDLRGIKLTSGELIGVRLRGANLRGANLRGANLSEADLRGANLSGANLSEADLRRANLRGAILIKANLRRADLNGVDLNRADLIGADLTEADLIETYLIETVFDEKQVDELCGKYNINDSRVYISEIGKIISYKEYCMRRKKKRNIKFSVVRMLKLLFKFQSGASESQIKT